jgi:hypothetical protein
MGLHGLLRGELFFFTHWTSSLYLPVPFRRTEVSNYVEGAVHSTGVLCPEDLYSATLALRPVTAAGTLLRMHARVEARGELHFEAPGTETLPGIRAAFSRPWRKTIAHRRLNVSDVRRNSARGSEVDEILYNGRVWLWATRVSLLLHPSILTLLQWLLSLQKATFLLGWAPGSVGLLG